MMTSIQTTFSGGTKSGQHVGVQIRRIANGTSVTLFFQNVDILGINQSFPHNFPKFRRVPDGEICTISSGPDLAPYMLSRLGNTRKCDLNACRHFFLILLTSRTCAISYGLIKSKVGHSQDIFWTLSQRCPLFVQPYNVVINNHFWPIWYLGKRWTNLRL